MRGNRSSHDAGCSMLDARCSMLVKDPVSRIEHRGSKETLPINTNVTRQ
ncbi:MAG: hypothetical protein AB1797_03990 [bacterium]